MNTYAALKEESEHVRVYRGKSNYCDEAAWYASYMARKYPDSDWQNYPRIVAGLPEQGAYDIAVKHLIQWGSSDACIIEDAFHLKLPESIHAFYRNVTEAVLLWNKVFHFLHPIDVVAWEQEARQSSDCKNLPIQMIRFCKTDADSLALRYNPRNDSWNIVFAAYYEPTEEIQSPQWDEQSIARDIEEVLDLLMRQDGLIFLEERTFMERIH